MNETAVDIHPFPGLRPFQANEHYLFFGREAQSDDLLRRLRAHRFLAVVGASGSGKSSLVRAGLLPALHGGFLVEAGSRWRIALFRPGRNPIHELAKTLNTPEVFGDDTRDDDEVAMWTSITEATLRRGTRGLVDVVVEARRPSDENLLVVVDQFEELFRFKAQAEGTEGSEDAAAFVKLLLEATRTDRVPLYVVLTMRSDFLGDCVQFRDLPETINDAQFLVPRLTRDQRRRVIAGPVAVGGGQMTPRLVQRLLNDVGDNPDQLPILQHALMRTWGTWLAQRRDGDPIDLPHYQAIGGMAHALSQHGDEVYDDLPDDCSRALAELMFKRLTDRGLDARGIRRPTAFAELCAVCEATPEEVASVIEAFRRPDRSLLMPPAGTPLEPDTIIDISHESLMRVWDQLKTWVEEEARSARIYRSLAETAVLWDKGKASLWRDPELQQAVDWHGENRPNEAWATRYHPAFVLAMRFLKKSRAGKTMGLWIKAGAAVLVLATLFILSLLFSIKDQRDSALLAEAEARRQEAIALEQRQRAVEQANLADSRRMASVSATLLDNAYDQALLVSRSAFEKAATAAAQHALLTALQHKTESFTRLHGHKTGIKSVAVSPDGTRLVSGSSDGAIILWDVQTGELITTFEGHDGGVTSVAISPDGRMLASGGFDNTVILWDVATGDQIQSLEGLSYAVSSVAFSPGGEYLACGIRDGSIILWTIGKVIEAAGTLQGPPQAVNSVFFAETDEDLLISGSSDGSITIWDLDTREPAYEPIRAEVGKITSLDIHEEDDRLIYGTDNGKVVVMENFDQVQALRGGFQETVTSVAFSPDGWYVAAGSTDDTVLLWDLDKEEGGEPRVFEGHAGDVTHVIFSPDGAFLITASEDDTIIIWPLDEATRREPLSTSLRSSSAVNSIAFSPDGHLLASGHRDDTIILWDVPAREMLGNSTEANQQFVTSVAFSPDGQLLASGGRDGTVGLWDAATGDSLRQLQAQKPGVESVAFSPNGRLASGSSDASIVLWDTATGNILQRLRGHGSSVAALAFSPDGRLLASGSRDDVIILWDAVTGDSLDVLRGHEDDVVSVAFSPPDGKILASGSKDATVALWDIEARTQLSRLEGHASWVNSVAFSPDGRFLASGSADDTIRFWDLETGEVLATLTEHTTSVVSVVFSPDGQFLASGSDDQTIRLWPLDAAVWLAQACRVANRNLTLDEWQQFISREAPYECTCPDLPPGPESGLSSCR